MNINRSKTPTKFYTIAQIAECVDSLDADCPAMDKKRLARRAPDQRLVRISEADFQAFLAAHRRSLGRPPLSTRVKQCQSVTIIGKTSYKHTSHLFYSRYPE